MTYDEIFTFENLYLANKKCKRGKEHKKEVIEFQMSLGINLWELFYELKYNKYHIGKYHKFKIFDPKEREIEAISYRDRIVQRTLCDEYLIPLISKYLIFDNAACRVNKGSSFAIKRVKDFLIKMLKNNSREEYFVKIDISKFFDSINHDLLKVKLKRIVEDDDIFHFLEVLIDSYGLSSNKGLPMGNQSSQLFALLYLNDIDHFIKEKLHVKNYVRYMDDFFFLASTKEKARQHFRLVIEKIKEEDLKVNPKSQIVSFNRGIEFIGYRIHLTKSNKVVLKIRNSTKRRILKKVKIRKNNNAKDIERTISSYQGMFKYSSSFTFKKRIKELIKVGFKHSF